MTDTIARPQGVQRSEPWLSLEDDEQQTRRLIARLAHEIWSSVIVGNPAPVVARRSERMRNPVAGDLVIETSSVWYPRSDIDSICKGVGYLVAAQDERVWSDEVMAADPDGFSTEDANLTERVWYVQYGPNAADVCRWVNAEFVAVDLNL